MDTSMDTSHFMPSWYTESNAASVYAQPHQGTSDMRQEQYTLMIQSNSLLH